jgi:hypothetical protein
LKEAGVGAGHPTFQTGRLPLFLFTGAMSKINKSFHSSVFMLSHPSFYNKDKAKRLPHSTFDVERSMFDVQIFATEITTKPSYNVEITYSNQKFRIGAKALNFD